MYRVIWWSTTRDAVDKSKQASGIMSYADAVKLRDRLYTDMCEVYIEVDAEYEICLNCSHYVGGSNEGDCEEHGGCETSAYDICRDWCDKNL